MTIERHALPDDWLEHLAQRFDYHGRHIYGVANSLNSSPLYAHLALNIAEDPDLLRLLENADLTTTVTNLLFGAVHYLLISDPHDPLARFYPDLADHPPPIENVYPSFRAFCLNHEANVRHLVTTRFVQTNEVGRCAGLLPSFHLVAQHGNGRPLALIEVGASAGLHLLWDHYGYLYDDAGDAGDLSSPVQITSTPRGPYSPPVQAPLPVIAFRKGIDLHPINVHDEAETRWLRALIWPEHRDRRRLLDAALAVARQHRVEVVAGDAAQVLPDILESIPDEMSLCIYHSYTLNQMPAEIRDRILTTIRDHARKRDLYRVSQEWYAGQEQPQIELHTYTADGMTSELLAYSESHGRWVEWLVG